MTDDDSSGRSGATPNNFIRGIIDADRAEKRYDTIVTRFPPEPNGYLHIGHSKAICLNFGLARDYQGRCHLRFDDTNPAREDVEYVESIQRDIRWLGFDWGDDLFFASDYFEKMYDFAVRLIEDGLAYVDSQTVEEIRTHRGTLSEPGTASPYRDRSVAENLDLFARMRAGEFENGAHVLRAKIDMAAPNMLMRDPLLYRIRHDHHDRTGDTWCIYPMYDYAHCLSDAIEGITHSLCTLEFENNRELYDWVLDKVGFEEPRTHQYEFARLSLEYTIMSKRKLLQLVNDGHVSGWDDPRMPTLAGMRRRGITPEAIRAFADLIGVAKNNSSVDYAKLEYCIRDDLNHRAPRVMAVLRPLKVTLTNYPEGESEALDASYWPHDVPREGSRSVPFGKHLYIERTDFSAEPPKGYYRLAPGREVRLRYAYFITGDEVVRDADGEVVELLCSYDPETKGGNAPDGRKVKGTIHWVSAEHTLTAEVRVYDRLFSVPMPGRGAADFLDHVNPNSVEVTQARIEPSLAGTEAGAHFQFERQGYFFTDPVDSRPDALVFNRVTPLRDSWAKQRKASLAEAVAETVAAAPAAVAGQDASRTRPEKRSRAEQRQRARELDPTLTQRLAAFQSAHGLDAEDADLLTADRDVAALFEAAVVRYDAPRAIAKWIINAVLAEVKDRPVTELPFDGAALGALVELVETNVISARAAKDVLAELADKGGEPLAIVERLGLRQLSDEGAINEAIDAVLAANPDNVAAYRGGKTKLQGFFVGQVMKATAGKANPGLVAKLVRHKLDA